MSQQLIIVIIEVLAFVPAIVLHECAHGFAASCFGDPTAKSAGRLSLNPITHIDPFGTVILPLLLMFAGAPVFGYAKPVPYNPVYFKNKRLGELVVGLAGPAANLFMALLAAVIAWVLWPFAHTLVLQNDIFAYFYLLFLPQFALINLYLLFFNLIPVPPLDGSSAIGFFIPERALPAYWSIQRYALPIFMAVVILLPYVLNFNPIGIYLNATAGAIGQAIFPFKI